uniref:DUF1640 domain-containing protein n=1 Tax=Ignisphaera aggregans TaxID=334771 RepID=A0A7C5THW0_9CREN
MESLSAELIIKLFEEDAKSRKRLAELLVIEPDIRLAIINAVLRDVATKQDIEILKRDINNLSERVAKLEGAFQQLVDRIDDLDKRIDSLDKRIDSLDKRIDFISKVTLALTASVLATLIANIIFLR